MVGTPIGNLEDITFRAVRVLGEADLVAAEDTRRTGRLLARYGIATALTSYHEHNERGKAALILEKLAAGRSVALVTDAGTPGVSDPGYRLVRLAAARGVRVEAVPGPSAVTALLSVAGLGTERFTFLGFVPTAAGRRREMWLEMKARPSTYVIFESPRRLGKTLAEMAAELGDVEAVVGREMTKLHEEVVRGRLTELAGKLAGGGTRGEVTIAVRTEPAAASADDVEAELARLLDSGLALREAARAAAASFDISRSEAYALALRLKRR